MNLHPVACTRCRSFKRKCSRELPACQRCRRLGFDCGYLPTRRKRLVEHPSRNGTGSSKGTSSVVKNGHLATEFNSLMVFDSYFSLFIPSSFICHQPRVKRQYIEGTISAFMRDSIFSIALLLLQSKTAFTEPSGLPRTRPPSELWAERANMAVKQVFRPTLETVQTLYNISAYWCATGKTHYLKEAASNAMRSAQQVAVRSPRLPVGEASELKQSCFWIAMTCRCLLNNDETVASFDAVLEDQLPTREDILPQRPDTLLGSELRGNIMRLVEIWCVKVFSA
ncbi:Zn(II)2Cys6 transcription factor [Aspergillus melleus]|uniref:Zn(II)2Cys6 transcription factor n=1 Tax=Aspergillus melleus TaxID=138277 RepID=UPI001E8DE340|nr:uncharacterized protein LDX57_010742 [Aspergillus melleus]KAH8433108.1 hypothetical protein LDX57_010742 [Aspergillus melleus]